MKFKFAVSIAILLAVGQSFAQTRQVSGTVTDEQTGESVPFANVFVPGTTVGVAADFDGHFSLTVERGDSLGVSAVGFNPARRALSKEAKQEINFNLSSSAVELAAVVIRPTENPAIRFFKQVLAHKKENNPRRQETYQCSLYEKASVSIKNFNQRFADKGFIEQFAFVFESADSLAPDQNGDLPVYFSETAYDLHQNSGLPRKVTLHTHAQSIGMEEEHVSTYLDRTCVDVNVYDNLIELFGKNFISPLNPLGLATYRYYLVDSVEVAGQRSYQLKFKPRRKQELTFEGDMWVNGESYAIESITASVSKDANLNFISAFKMEQTFQSVASHGWMPAQQILDLEFKVVENQRSKKQEELPLRAEKTTVYRNYQFGEQPETESIQVAGPLEIESSEAIAYFDAHRPVSLTARENHSVAVMDSVKQLPLVKAIKNIAHTFSTGYYPLGDIEIGPYFNLLSTNPIEGTRYNLAFRTSKHFSDRVRVVGSFGYGQRDKQFKYTLTGQWLLDQNTHTVVSLQVRDDLERLGRGLKQSFYRENKLSADEDNIISSILRRRPNHKLLRIKSVEARIESELLTGVRSELIYTQRIMTETARMPLTVGSDVNPARASSFQNQEITLGHRIAFREKTVRGHFRTLRFGSPFPVLFLNLTAGTHNFGGRSNYFKPSLIVKHKVALNRLGWIQYVADVGMIKGRVPYPLLEIHAGNETFSFYRYAGNLLNYGEFASDRYVNLFAEHHLGGLVLNKVPLLRKLEWREVVSGKMMYGTLSKTNDSALLKEAGIKSFTQPYYELGAGIENIFKVFRVEAVWRMNYRDQPGVSNFGIRGRMQITF